MRLPLVALEPYSHRGSLMVDLLVGLAVLVILVTATVFLTLKRTENTDRFRALGMISDQMASSLTSIYYRNNRNYFALTADAAGKAILINEGADSNTPWNGNWVVRTAGDGTSVQLAFDCGSFRTGGALCQQVKSSLDGGLNEMVTASSIVGTELLVTYGRPR